MKNAQEEMNKKMLAEMESKMAAEKAKHDEELQKKEAELAELQNGAGDDEVK